ncbi:hypothetical protein FHL15_003089 [Xylaria flabelliformis]|uniref:Uncharacterized protein n=1 Tax=Xylaria flabelliformis TaxID=2512241 RepID=A0A553I6Y0_9PEZI|nr:hypothetical protein FHL15_003089 [Xylaria flabelliformis]
MNGEATHEYKPDKLLAVMSSYFNLLVKPFSAVAGPDETDTTTTTTTVQNSRCYLMDMLFPNVLLNTSARVFGRGHVGGILYSGANAREPIIRQTGEKYEFVNWIGGDYSIAYSLNVFNTSAS